MDKSIQNAEYDQNFSNQSNICGKIVHILEYSKIVW